MAYYQGGNEEKQQQYQDASRLKEKVEIYISCRDLLSLDFLSLSDPFVVVSLRDDNGKFQEIGRTEVIWDKTNVEFETTVTLDYYFEKEQLLKFDVYDCDNKDSLRLSDHDFLGSCTATLGEMIHAPGATLTQRLLGKNGKPLKNKKSKMYQRIILRTEQAAESKGKYKLEFAATNLPKMDSWFGKVDPYFRVCRIEDTEKNEYKLSDYKIRAQKMQYKSEAVKREYNPKWKPFDISTGKLFYKNKLKQFEIQIWDWDNADDDDFIGSVLLTEKDLTDFKSNNKMPKSFNIDLFDVKLQKKYAKTKDKDKPKLILRNVTPIASLYDFLQGGCDFSLMVAVDYTGSNLEHAFGNNPATDLHHIYYDTHIPSNYQMAIRKIGNILETYDSDKQYPLFGFGAWGRFRDNPQVTVTKHGFNVNTEMLGANSEEVAGIYGLENAYRASVDLLRQKTFQLSGPTYFSEILNNAKKTAAAAFRAYKQGQANLQYFILLIITDGAVSSEDMLKTINEIVDIATQGLPVSIIIVGVGKGPFGTMNLLDGDFLEDVNEIENDPKLSKAQKEEQVWNLVSKTGYKMEYIEALKKCKGRDIVDFVQLDEFDDRTLRNKMGKTLEAETLEEIPDHFIRFIQFNGISPPDPSDSKEVEMNNNNNNNNLGVGAAGGGGYDDPRFRLQKSFSSQSVLYPELEDEGLMKGYNNRNLYFDDAPLPPGWERGYMPDGRCYYVNHKSHLTQWMHPDDPTSPQQKLNQMNHGAAQPGAPPAPYAN